jgi:hemolysin III
LRKNHAPAESPTTKVKPLLRGHFHQAMFFVALGACVPLTLRSRETDYFYATLIYSVCALTMFGISTIYHRVTWSPQKRALWKKFDHCGIYLMIAGCFTPIASVGLSPESSKVLLSTIWIIAALGMIQSIFFTNIPKIASSILYMFAGYMVLPYFSELYESIGPENSVLIVVGGVVYSVGAISYGLKRPVFKPNVFGYHEFFHILINIGAIVHFLVINSLIK